MEYDYSLVDVARDGDMVAISPKQMATKYRLKGTIISDADSNTHRLTKSFKALIRIVYHPGSIKVGYMPTVFGVASMITCKLVEVIKTVGRGKKDMEHSPSELFTGDTALVRFEPLKSITLEVFSEFGRLGRIVVRDMGCIIAIGKVVEVESIQA